MGEWNVYKIFLYDSGLTSVDEGEIESVWAFDK